MDTRREHTEATSWRSGLGWVLLFLLVCAAWYVYPRVLAVVFPSFIESTSQPTERGVFGDSFGALNALFAGLAFAGLICAIFLQRKELRYQREELQLQRKELCLTRQELQRSAEAQEKSVQALQKQVEQAKAEAKANEAQRWRTESLRLIQEWDEPCFAGVRRESMKALRDFDGNKHKTLILAGMYPPLDDIRQFLGYFERLGIMVQHKHVDEALLPVSLFLVVKETWRVAKPFMDSAFDLDDLRFYNGFKFLAEHWGVQE